MVPCLKNIRRRLSVFSFYTFGEEMRPGGTYNAHKLNIDCTALCICQLGSLFLKRREAKNRQGK